MTFPSFRLLCGVLLLGAFFLHASAQTNTGSIKTVRISNDVQVLSANGSKHALATGDMVTEGDTVVTGINSSVVLVFMNGSTVKVGAETRISIDEFKMDPFGEDIVVGKLDKGEPSVSRTTLNVSYGEIVGNVKKLSKSSSYKINTPVGAAGIRGTVFRIKITKTADGLFRFILDTAEGMVEFYATTIPGGTEVAEGQSLIVDAVINTFTGQVESARISDLTGISPEGNAAIDAALNTALLALIDQQIFTEQQRINDQNTSAEQFTGQQPVNPDTRSVSGIHPGGG